MLTPDALRFVGTLCAKFEVRRQEILQARKAKAIEYDAGELPHFVSNSPAARDPTWRCAPIPSDIQDRRVEITGPVDRKMVINGLNSGAQVYMADFEDSTSPTWTNIIEGQLNIRDAVRGTISYTNPANGKVYSLKPQTSTLFVRPRGWHLDEAHVTVNGKVASGSIFDFAMYLFHNVQALTAKGTGPYYYLPKLESHLEARLWNDVFVTAQQYLGVSVGTCRATVLLETITAAFEMEEILYELRQHAAGLNAGRWDYIFSVIKKFRNRPEFLLPNRAQISMTTPFMRAYTELLVQTCHKRGAHAIGGMAAYIPRKDPAANELAFAKVRADKERESADGFDGTWVAHPGLVPVARQIFEDVLGDRPHQKERQRADVHIAPADLLNFNVAGGYIDEEGLRLNINVSLLYLASWLDGVGAAALYDLMEDTATAEISRAQIWQWINHNSAALTDGRKISVDLVRRMIPEEMAKIEALVGEAAFAAGKFTLAAEIFDQLVSARRFIGFLTLLAYDYL
jgi:malate synthase